MFVVLGQSTFKFWFVYSRGILETRLVHTAKDVLYPQTTFSFSWPYHIHSLKYCGHHIA